MHKFPAGKYKYKTKWKLNVRITTPPNVCESSKESHPCCDGLYWLRECNRNTSESTARPPSSEHNLSWNIMAGEAEKHVRGLIYKTNWSILKYMYLLIKHYFDVEVILFLEKSSDLVIFLVVRKGYCSLGHAYQASGELCMSFMNNVQQTHSSKLGVSLFLSTH